MQDVTQPVHVGVSDGVDVEEVVWREGYSSLAQGRRVFLRPDGAFGLLKDGCTVLDDEIELRIQM